MVLYNIVDNNKTITQADYQVVIKKMARMEKENEILKKPWTYMQRKKFNI